jgi:hypothetical protein
MLKPGKRWYLPAALTLGAFLGGPLLVQARAVAPLTGFMVFALSGLLGAVALLWGLRVAAAGRRRDGLVSAVIGAVPLAVIAFGILSARKVPRINDVSTDLDNPPRFVTAASAPENAGLDLAYPPEFKEQVRQGYPDLISKVMAEPPAVAYEAVKAAARAMPGWEIARTDDAAMTVEGTQTSAVFRFVDDFAIRVEPIDGKSLVAMRSRSRVGKGDFGANAARIRAFLGALGPKDPP